MGDNGLLEDARSIEEKAIEVEYQELQRAAGMSGSPGPVYIPRDHIEEKYRGKLSPLFEPFTQMPEASSYDTPIQSLEDAMKQLSSGNDKDPINGGIMRANPDLGHVESAGSKLENWTGEAADNFKRNFLDKFPYISKNQFLLLGVMKGALEADQKRWDDAAEDIKQIVTQTKSGLDNVLSSGKNELSFAFSVASAVAAVGAIPFTGGASAVIAAVGAAGSVGNAGMAGAKATLEKDCGTAESVVQAMRDAIERLTKEIQKSGDKVAKALSGIPDQVSGGRSDFISPRPELAGMGDGRATSDEGLGQVN